MTITVQRETLFTQQISVVGVDDGVSFKLVWSWRKHARAGDWNLAKTVVKADGEITAELSEQQASQLPFVDGYVSIYKIDAVSSKKTLSASYDVRVDEGTSGSDYTAVASLQTAIPINFASEGGATVGALQGYFTASADGYLTSIVAGAQDAPLGDSIIFDIYKNGVTTASTITLAAGEVRNTATISIAVSQDDYIEVYLTQVGDIGSGTFPWCNIDYQAS